MKLHVLLAPKEKSAAAAAPVNEAPATEPASAPVAVATTKPSGPSSSMLSFLSANREEVQGFKVKNRLTLPTLLTPDQMPIGSQFVAEVVNVVESPVTTVKAPIIHFRSLNGEEFTFPCTGVLRDACTPERIGKKREDETDSAYGKRVLEAMQSAKGKILLVRRLPDGESKEYKKRMFKFEVFELERE